MKISELLIFVVLVGLIFLAFTTLAGTINNDYIVKTGGDKINTTLWDDKYNYTNKINDSVSPVLEKLQIVGDPEEGWFTRLANGLIAIPQGIISFVTLGVQSIGFTNTVLSSFAVAVNIPSAFVMGIIVIITTLIVIQLINFFNKSGEA